MSDELRHPWAGNRKLPIYLDAYEMSNILALVEVAGYGGEPALQLSTGDWIGQLYWKIKAAVSAAHITLPPPNKSPAEQLASVRRMFEDT